LACGSLRVGRLSSRPPSMRGVAALLGALAPLAPFTALAAEPRADVLRVQASGAPGSYELAVTGKSPDRSCDAYTVGWERARGEGKRLSRRVLRHSHPEEQPSPRPGGPFPTAADATVVVRAHFHPAGYGGAALRGSVARGFAPWAPPAGFAAA